MIGAAEATGAAVVGIRRSRCRSGPPGHRHHTALRRLRAEPARGGDRRGSVRPGEPGGSRDGVRPASTWATVRRVASVPLIAFGSAFQGGGFFLALRQAATTRREEVPDHPPLHSQAAATVARRVERALVWAKLRSPRTQTVELRGSGGARFGGSGRPSFRRGGLWTEERFDALEDEVQDHRAKQQDEHAALERKIDSVTEAVDATADRLESERKQRLVSALQWEEAGVWTFILGLVITTVGAVV
jgi:hypothetical protein